MVIYGPIACRTAIGLAEPDGGILTNVWARTTTRGYLPL